MTGPLLPHAARRRTPVRSGRERTRAGRAEPGRNRVLAHIAPPAARRPVTGAVPDAGPAAG
ncbi:hypothetical protein GCM10018781_33000 [Kitasatospora indigofera]|uniref:Uncharacterized protein n=1 Tax=Kitasatospora indigofera TaxID=67307 RepID=A0A919KT60_9ACTN|nr:hypothetical protein GCM10018781_33000 [Kitasatospora indigofera]